MEEEIENKKIAFEPIKTLENKYFLVKDYQRGYKWGKDEITALLNDIYNHKNGKYCLQPLIVKEENNQVEVIDGQQRITSIYLILFFLEKKKYYEIDYQTRDSTKDFLKNKLNLLYESIENKLCWQDFINENKNFDNVDIYHIYVVFQTISNWFLQRDENFNIEEYVTKIKNDVSIIWYDINKDEQPEEPEDIFLNLNAGKVPLTNSELIKALFILNCKKENTEAQSNLKAFEIAQEWDKIEIQLKEENFWYYICDHNYYNTIDTRIDFIIDLANKISPPSKGEWDGKNAYRQYEKQYLNGEILDWKKIKKTFSKLTEWYEDNEDKEIYHYIGFLINTEFTNLRAIIDLSENKTKPEFKRELLKKIEKKLNEKKIIKDNEISHYHLDNLDYDVNSIPCKNILLLLNIDKYIKDSSDNKFPFDLYSKGDWSVEHINPQNAKEFKDLEAIINWLNSFKSYFIKDVKYNAIVDKINEFLILLNSESDKTIKLSKLRMDQGTTVRFNELIDEITEILKLHKIGNLALLDRNTNSKLGNKIFIDKRKILLKMYYQKIKNNVFIPEKTKDVFTKNYTQNNEGIVDEIFSLIDMDDYKEHIKNQLLKYYQTNLNG